MGGRVDHWFVTTSYASSVASVARRAVHLVRIRARTGRGIARASVVALVEHRASDWIAADAGARLASIRLRTGVSVVASASVGLERFRAKPGCEIAGPG